MIGYVDDNICSACGGKCCRGMPGILHPSDLREPIEETIFIMLLSGKYQIDCWEGDPTNTGKYHSGYYLRPAIKLAEGIFNFSWGGECIVLNGNGCSLDLIDRPFNCRMLKPSLKSCEAGKHDKHWFALEWLKYNETLKIIGDFVDELR